MLPSVGYYRHLPVEGVAAMRPSLVLASDHAGPPSAMAQIKALGIPVETVSDQPTIDSLNVRIRQIANALGLQQAGESLIMQIEQERLAAFNLPIQNRSAMLVVMRSGKLLGAGGDTAANTVIQQAGLRNVLESLKSYQAITPEAVSTLAPEVIIVTSSTVKAMGGLEQIKADLSLVHTPAVKNDRVIELEDLLAQGFGPRSAEATVKIRKALSYD